MYCPYCGEPVGDADNFCTSCGRHLPRGAPGRPDVSAARPAPVSGAGKGPSRRPPARTDLPPAADSDNDGSLFPPPAPPAPERPARRASGWGSPLTAVLNVLACVLALASVVLCALAPLVEVPFLAGTSTASDDAIQATLSVLDPGLSVVAGGLLGTDALGVFDLASLGISLSEALSDQGVALATGLFAGIAVVAAGLCAAGAVSSLALRRATPVLVWGALLGALAGGCGLGGVLYLNQRFRSWLLFDTSATFREMGVSIIPSSVQVVVQTPWLVAVIACAFAALLCAVWARSRWKREHRVRP